MLPKDAPYPFDDMPNENYFGEFRELSNSIGPHAKKDKDTEKDTGKDNEDKNKTDDVSSVFPVFPKY